MSYWCPPSEKRESSSVIVDENRGLLVSSMAPLAPFMLDQAGGGTVGSQEMYVDASNRPQLMVNGNINAESLNQQHRLVSNGTPDMNARMQNQQCLVSNGNFLMSELNAGPLSRNQIQSSGNSLLPQMNAGPLRWNQLQSNGKSLSPELNAGPLSRNQIPSSGNSLLPQMNAEPLSRNQLQSHGNSLLPQMNAGPLSRNQLQSNGNSVLPQMNEKSLNQQQLKSNRKFSMPDMNVEFSNQQTMLPDGSSLSPELNAISNRWLLYNANILSQSNRTYVNGRLLQPLAPKPQASGSPPFLRNLDSFPENNNVKRFVVNDRTVSPATPATMEKSRRVRTPDPMHREIIDLDDEPETYPDVHQRMSSTLQQFITDNPAEKCLSNQVVSSQTFSSYLKQFASHTPQICSHQQQFVAENRAEQYISNQLQSSPNSYQQEGQRNTAANSSQILSSYQQGGEGSAAVSSCQILSSYQLGGERNAVVNSSQNFSPHQLEGERDVVVSSSENVPVQQGDLDNQEIDLNKTPSQKLKRKKHRPKVIREGKAARTPKTATPKPRTPGRSEMTGSPVAKRKYVRKKKGPNPQEISSGAMGEIVDSDSQNKNKSIPNVLGEVVDPDNQSRNKPVRRSLYFDLEDSQAIEGFRQNARETEPRGAAQEGGVTCNTISATQSYQQQGLIELESSRDCSANGLKRHQVSENITVNVSDATNMVIGNHHMSNNDPCYHEVHKKRRMEDGLISDAVSALAFPASCRNPSYFLTESTANEFTFADAQRLAHEKKQALERMLVFNQAMRERNNRPVHAHGLTSQSAVVDCRRVSTPTELSSRSRLECYQPSTPEKPPGYSKNLDYETCGPQARVELLRASQMKEKTIKRKKKEQVSINNPLLSNGKQMDHVSAYGKTDSSARAKSTQKYYTQKTASVQTTAAQGYLANIKQKVSDSVGLQSGQVVLCQNPIDDIIWKLLHLKLDGGHEDALALPQNALVPYAGEGGMIVPFRGPFELKKKKARPKVDLDPESNRVWNLLMGKESSGGEEGTEKDKAKWWEEERRVFRGRADSFIARMHLIQGDRRFSKWKGSVVDSVIGVFLTQNVSDHLSSSAFMCLAARFPPKEEGNYKTASAEMISRPIAVHDTIRWQDKTSEQEFCYQNLSGINEAKQIDNKVMTRICQSPEINNGGVCVDYCKQSNSVNNEGELHTDHGSPSSASGTTVTVASCTSTIECEDRPLDDVVSLQNSVASSQSSSECDDRNQDNRSSLLNLETEELLSGGLANGFTSFTELLHMESNRNGGLLNGSGNGRKPSAEYGNDIDCFAHSGMNKSPSIPNGPTYLSCSGPSYKSNSHFHPLQYEFLSSPCASPSYCHKDSPTTGSVGLQKAYLETNQSYQSHLTPSASEISKTNTSEIMGKQLGLCAGSSTNAMEQNKFLISNAAPCFYPCASIMKNSAQPVTSSGIGVGNVKQSCSSSEASSERNCSSLCMRQQDGNAATYQEKTMGAEIQVKRIHTESQAQIQNCNTPQPSSNSHNRIPRNDLYGLQANQSNLTNEACTSKVSAETLNNASKGKKVKTEKKTYDWDSLRRQACQNGVKKERSRDTMDSLDYEAVRCADVSEISNAIRERGMNNMLAERMKDFLNRLVKDHGSIDLEWLRDVPPDKVKDYLLSIRGLGLKSVECVRLLTLHHLAFPVDTNVGRICVRLGWVPLQPLPESLQLHLLEMYPVLETIQKYLWPRLCKLDQRTLYELHYQLITFGKVFCTKSRPNCNACPMRGECKHFASAFASARLSLPGPEEKNIVPSEIPISFEAGHAPAFNLLSLPQFEGSTLSHERMVMRNCEPIIEEPATPEPECIGASEIDIEDAFYNDPEEIPTIKLNLEEFTQNLQDYMQKNNMGILQDGDMSKALVAIAPEAASIPTPKLKNVSRLRTEHQVYELPDGHPLLEGLDKREPDDPCPYLLAIWTPGETAQSIEPPTAYCNSQETGKLCDKKTCFSCNSIREAQAQTVRGTILIPCRTANRGSFPLNGTYFQVNEVFADHHSSRDPIDVPRNWIWNLHRRTVYFGTSIPSIFKGLTTEGIQHCFWRGFVCVRGFDRTTRAPKPLFARLHIAASKVTRNRRTTTATEQQQQGK